MNEKSDWNVENQEVDTRISEIYMQDGRIWINVTVNIGGLAYEVEFDNISQMKDVVQAMTRYINHRRMFHSLEAEDDASAAEPEQDYGE